MLRIIDIASHVATPLALAGLFAAVLFLVFRQLLSSKFMPRLARGSAGDIIKRIINYLFVLSLVAMLLGFAGYIIQITGNGLPIGSGGQTNFSEPWPSNRVIDRTNYSDVRDTTNVLAGPVRPPLITNFAEAPASSTTPSISGNGDQPCRGRTEVMNLKYIGDCTWETGVRDFGQCQITKVIVRGTGQKPESSSITIERIGNFAASVRGRSASGTGGKWFVAINDLNCSRVGCASGNYRLKVSGRLCNEVQPTVIEAQLN